MSRKTNPLSLRLGKSKNWASKSFLEDYNYSKVLYQDLYIRNYVKNVVEHNLNACTVHNVTIERNRENVFIFLEYHKFKPFVRVKRRYSKRKVRLLKRNRARSTGSAFNLLRGKSRARRPMNPVTRRFDRNAMAPRLRRKYWYKNRKTRLARFLREKVRVRARRCKNQRRTREQNRRRQLRGLPSRGIKKKRRGGSRRPYRPLRLRGLRNLSPKVAKKERRRRLINILRRRPKRRANFIMLIDTLTVRSISKVRKRHKYLCVSTLKRLIILNLTFLTDCHINLYVRNIARLKKLPFTVRLGRLNPFMKSLVKKKVTIKKLMKKLRIFRFLRALRGYNGSNFIHTTYSSFEFKNPRLLGVFLGRILKKNIRRFSIFYNFFSRALRILYRFSSLNGLRVRIRGRLGTSLRKKAVIMSFGSMPSQTFDSDIKYSFNEVITIYGVCGIKIWYYY